MDADSGLLAGLATLVSAAFAFFGKILLDERASTKEARKEIREVRADHEDCMDKHAIQSELVGGLKESVRILTQYQPPPVQQRVQAVLDVVEAKVEARIEAKKNGA